MSNVSNLASKGTNNQFQKGGKGRKGFGGDGAIIEEAGESGYDKGPMTEISKID
jgi:hypothetical protein